MAFLKEELEQAYGSYKRTRERIDAGELWWDALRDHFTEDAVFVDPAWEGRFSFEQDLINMVHMLEVMKESGWKPGAGFQNPPKHRVRLCAWEP